MKERYTFHVTRLTPAIVRLARSTKSPWKAKIAPVLVGSEAERAVAEKLSREGFNLVYQSKASRGAFDLLAVLNAHKVGLQIKVVAKLP